MEKTKRGTASSILGWLVCLGALPLLSGMIGCSTSQPVAQSTPRRDYSSFVGPAGADGPAGAVGTQGAVGATGARGAGIAGAVGEQGPSGPAGVRGQTGATGAPGEVAIGRAGVAGPAGPAGAQGVIGETGEQGYSVAGSAGAVGRSGREGAQGVSGDTGVRGPTLVGPTGPAGRSGPAGAQGSAGDTGARGSTTVGPVGATGVAGEPGLQGPLGATGAQGPAGVIAHWTSYRDFWFDYNRADLHASEDMKVTEVAHYLRNNPSLKVGIDSSMPQRGSDPRDQSLSNRRANSVREALVSAGVPKEKIQMGAFGDPQLLRDRRVQVLLRTIN